MSKTANFLRQRRLQLNVSMQHVADLIGCSQVFVHKVETGKKALPILKLSLWAEAYRIDKDKLVELFNYDHFLNCRYISRRGVK